MKHPKLKKNKEYDFNSKWISFRKVLAFQLKVMNSQNPLLLKNLENLVIAFSLHVDLRFLTNILRENLRSVLYKILCENRWLLRISFWSTIHFHFWTQFKYTTSWTKIVWSILVTIRSSSSHFYSN